MNLRDEPNNEPVELAIGRVLDAERAAHESLADAHARAQARLTASREQARLVAERAEGRLTRARQSIESRIAAREAQVDAKILALRASASPPSAEGERIDLAVAAVAAALTTAGAR